jgi:predicted kinase
VSLLGAVPDPPSFELNWAALTAEHPFLAALHACPQNPEWHAEGDVGIHTAMVLDALVGDARWRALEPEDRSTVFLACLLHDVAKPVCTRREPDGRLTSRGHSRRGSHWVREHLWRMGAPPRLREDVAALVMHHQVPFFLADRIDGERLAITVSQTARCDLLELVAWADATGRRCDDQQRLIDMCWLFGETCRELGCATAPYVFPSDHTRFVYFRTEDRAPAVEVYDDRRVDVTVMSGLPGAGKDTWIAEHGGGRPVVSLDALRVELGIDPSERQGRIFQEARERARVHLRAEEPFVWNATNISRLIRKQVVDLLAGYGARVQLEHVEAPADLLASRNRARQRPVPQAVIDKLVTKWSPPDTTEAHSVRYHHA